MSKPTARQRKILKAMAKGYRVSTHDGRAYASIVRGYVYTKTYECIYVCRKTTIRSMQKAGWIDMRGRISPDGLKAIGESNAKE